MTSFNWEQAISDWFSSGSSPDSYCKKHGISRTSFYKYRKLMDDKYPLKSKNKKYPKTTFKDLTTTIPIDPLKTEQPTIVIKTRSGAVVELFL